MPSSNSWGIQKRWLRWILGGFLIGLLCLRVPTSAHGAGQGTQKAPARGVTTAPPQAIPKPSLDALATRVIAFWNLLVRGEKLQAMQFVEPSGRKNFDAWQLAQISEPRITTLAFTPKPQEMAVTVETKRTFPPYPALFTWPVTQNWVFLNGNWFVKVEQPSAAALFPTSPGKPNPNQLSPEELQKRQKAILDALKFETRDLDFGRVRRGDTVSLSLGYRLAGSEPFGIVLKSAPDDFFTHNLQESKLLPGKDQKIQIELLTRVYAGEFNEKFVFGITHQNIEVPYEFDIHGYVYAPVYARPGSLRFAKGEQSKEVVIKNDSQSQVTLQKPENPDFEVTPLPQTLPPGGTCALKVTVKKQRNEPNYIDSVSLDFERRVEDMNNLKLGILLNYEEIDPRKAQEMELRELIRKSGVPVKK